MAAVLFRSRLFKRAASFSLIVLTAISIQNSAFAFSVAGLKAAAGAKGQQYNCGQLQVVWFLFSNMFWTDPQWTDQTKAKVAETIQTELDPYDLVTIGDERSPDLKKYFLALDKNDCSYFESLWNEALKQRDAVALQSRDIVHRINPDKINDDLKSVEGKTYKEIPQDKRLQILAESTWSRLEQTEKENKLSYDRAQKESFVLSILDEATFPLLQPNSISQNNFEAFIANAYVQAFDPMNDYWNAQQAKEFQDMMSSNFGGVGIRVEGVPDGIVVSQVISGGPADSQKTLQAHDVILKVNDSFTTQSKPISDVTKAIRGPSGSDVKLTVRRNGQVMDVVVKRAIVKSQTSSCDGEKYFPVLYCQVPTFYSPDDQGGKGATQDLIDAIDQAVKKLGEKAATSNLNERPAFKAIMVDLRGNPGGSLQEAQKMSVLLTGDSVPFGTIFVYSRTRGEVKGMTASKADQTSLVTARKGLAPVLLANHGSASASEIVSGNFQAAGAGPLISDGAKHTYGKGSIQSLTNNFGLKGMLKATIGHYFLMNHQCPHHHGILADVVLPITKADDSYLEGSFPVDPLPLMIESTPVPSFDNSAKVKALLAGDLKATVEEAQKSVNEKSTNDDFLKAASKIALAYAPLFKPEGMQNVDAAVTAETNANELTSLY